MLRAQACNDGGCGAPLARQFEVEAPPERPDQPENLEISAAPGELEVSAGRADGRWTRPVQEPP